MCMPTFQICFRNIQCFLLTKLHEESNYHLDKTGQDDNNSIVAQIKSFSIQSSIHSLFWWQLLLGRKLCLIGQQRQTKHSYEKQNSFRVKFLGSVPFSAQWTSTQCKLWKKRKPPTTEKDKSYQFFNAVFQSLYRMQKVNIIYTLAHLEKKSKYWKAC